MISRTAQRPSFPLMDEDQQERPSCRQLEDLPLPGESLVVLCAGPGIPGLVEGLNTFVRF